MPMNNELLTNINKLHTTELGAERIRKNLRLDIMDIIEWSKSKIEASNHIIRKGKNWYIYIDDIVLTVNAHSFTIITAHIVKG
jgi:hypothetical protein